jgi:excisionase family DNA binding protein
MPRTIEPRGRRKDERKEEAAMVTADQLALRRKEAARVLGLSVTTIDRAIKRRDLIAKKYGSRVLVPRSEVERYLARLKGTAPERS